jgi:hypothetical protein
MQLSMLRLFHSFSTTTAQVPRFSKRSESKTDHVSAHQFQHPPRNKRQPLPGIDIQIPFDMSEFSRPSLQCPWIDILSARSLPT